MAHENRGRLIEVLRRNVIAEALVQKKPRRESHDAPNLDRCREPGENAYGAALGEAAEDDALRRDACRDLVLDERVDIGL